MELAPDDAAGANDLGYIFMQQEKYEQAQACFERALRIKPAYQLARNNLDLCAQRILVKKHKTKNKYTPKQGQYLAFISDYSRVHRMPPAEADLEAYFKVACSSVHQMIMTLEKRGLIIRNPGVARSIRVVLPKDELPELK
jgi:tetratricopeptide (TPR) repeat protein